MSELVEFDVAQQTAGHSKDKSGIKENQSGLSDVCVIEENQACGQNARWESVSGFPHDVKDNGDCKSSKECRHSTECYVWDLVVDV